MLFRSVSQSRYLEIETVADDVQVGWVKQEDGTFADPNAAPAPTPESTPEPTPE